MKHTGYPFKMTREWEDLSSETFIQYRLYCDTCGEKHQSLRFKKPSKHAGKLEWEEAYAEISTNLMIYFRHCLKCDRIVCREYCWNTVRAQCEECLNSYFAIKKSATGTDNVPHYSSFLGAEEAENTA